MTAGSLGNFMAAFKAQESLTSHTIRMNHSEEPTLISHWLEMHV